MNMKFILCGIPKGTKALKFSCDVKVDGVVRGKEKWFDARIMSNYTDNKGKKLAGGPTLGKWKGTKDWRRYEKTFNLKVSSDCIALMPCLFNVKAGELHIKNMCLEPAEGTGEKPKTPEEIAAEQAKKGEARRQEAAAIDAAAPKLGAKRKPIIGPVHENDTKTKVNAMRKMLNKPVVDSALLSTALLQDEGNVISNAPKKLAANTTNIRKKRILKMALVDNAFKALAPNTPVIIKPNNTYITTMLTP